MLSDDIINYINELLSKLGLTEYIGVIVYGNYVGNKTNSLAKLLLKTY